MGALLLRGLEIHPEPPSAGVPEGPEARIPAGSWALEDLSGCSVCQCQADTEHTHTYSYFQCLLGTGTTLKTQRKITRALEACGKVPWP